MHSSGCFEGMVEVFILVAAMEGGRKGAADCDLKQMQCLYYIEIAGNG